MKRVIEIFSSLKLTIGILLAAIVLIFFGTLAQVDLGLWEAQRRYFQSYFLWWHPSGDSAFSLPVWPGGYLLGWLFVANLVFAYGKRFKKLVAPRNIGLLLAHLGLLLLLVGQFVTEHLQVESAMRLKVGESRTYSESVSRSELAITESHRHEETETVIPERLLIGRGEIRDPRIPFAVRLDEWQPNSEPRLGRTPDGDRELTFAPVPRSRRTDQANMPSARVTVRNKQGQEPICFPGRSSCAARDANSDSH
jgi:hypothetical protein